MLSITGATRVFVAVVPIDLRGSFNALSGQVKQVLAQDPLSGHWFVFTNRRRNRLKILIWDGYENTEIMGQQLRPSACFWGKPRILDD